MPKENSQYWEGKGSLYAGYRPTGPERAHPRGTLNILFLIDVSGSMEGVKLNEVNLAMPEILGALMERRSEGVTTRVALMEFSGHAKWTTEEPVPVERFAFRPSKAQPWNTSYAAAFRSLDRKLQSDAFMDTSRGPYLPPLIIFVSDGAPDDGDPYPGALAELNENLWFSVASRYAIAVGSEAAKPDTVRVLSRFTGLDENVRSASGGGSLGEVLRHIALEASKARMQSEEPGGSIFKKPDERLFETIFER